MQTLIACGGCGAPLAPDQRYCLHCGAVQGDPRVAYREVVAAHAAPADAAPTAVLPAAAPAPVAPLRDWTPVIALGGLAALALVLVVGVLIGKSGSPAQPGAAPPQVITIGGAAPAAATTDGTAADAGSGTPKKRHAQKGSGGGKAAKATPKALQDLQTSSGADYQKKSAKLPDTVALPGKPPPKDDKAPGAGSGAETIG